MKSLVFNLGEFSSHVINLIVFGDRYCTAGFVAKISFIASDLYEFAGCVKLPPITAITVLLKKSRIDLPEVLGGRAEVV